MYSEKKFKNYIFWVKVRRIFLLLLFSLLGCLIGIFVSDLIKTLSTNDTYRIMIISISTLAAFAFSYLITIGTAKEVQDGYWKIAVLRKLTVISKKLDVLQKDDISSFSEIIENDDISSISKTVSDTIENLDLEPTKPKGLKRYTKKASL